MTRDEKLEALANVLQLAAVKALALSHPDASGPTREIALSRQLEGIAMEFRAIASQAVLHRQDGETVETRPGRPQASASLGLSRAGVHLDKKTEGRSRRR